MTVRTYTVPGISCGHCRAAIESELTPLAGVESVVVDVDSKVVTVTGEVTAEAVRAAIDEAGYEVSAVA